MGDVASGGKALFTNIKTSQPEDVIFDSVDLTRLSLIGTNVGRIELRNCTAAKLKGKRFRPRTDLVLYDEISQQWEYAPFLKLVWRKCKRPTQDYEAVLELYRGLRLNFEAKLRYSEAGDFHVGEMETRRLSLLANSNRRGVNCLIDYFVMWLYRSISLYGERYTRAALWFTALVLAFASLFMVSGVQCVTGEPVAKYDFWPCLTYSFTVATLFIRDKQYRYVGDWGWLFFIIESVLGALIMPFLAMAVRRRFKR